jgi:DNA-binding beta-propeller fold protein YncE
MSKLVRVAAVAAALALLSTGCSTAKPTSPTSTPSAKAPPATVTTTNVIALPGVGGHGDVVTADPAAHAVYVAQSPDNNLIVLDTRNNRIKAVVPHIVDGNGVDFSDLYVFVAEAGANRVAVISKSTWKVVATVGSGGKSPDAVYYDPAERTVFVANVDSDTMTEFSATSPFTVLGSLALQPSPAHNGPDLGTYVPSTDHIYQAVDNNVAVINAKTRTISSRFTLSLPAGKSAKDMYFDQAHHLLWVATDGKEVLALNPDNGAVVHTVKTASGTDEVSGDEDHGLLFLGEGKAGVMGVVDLATDRIIATVKTEPDAHTLAYLPHSNVVYAYLNTSNKVEVDHVNRS